jgi:4-amino-4-deoxy-L-arabinose transferase-like glycosyltransferase
MAALTAAAACLFLGNLGDQRLWQDEAQTALIAKTILTDGVPRGTDGKNFFSQESGREYGRDCVYRWHTWLSFYAVAGAFQLFGANEWTARLPFALMGLATVPLAYFFGRSLWQSRRAATLGAILLATSVPYLVLSRQCRYYSPCALFSLLGLFAYYHLVRRRRGAAVLFVVSAVLLFHSLFYYWAVLLVVVGVHAAVFHRDRLKAVAWASLATLLLNLPWLVWLLSPPAVGLYPERNDHWYRPIVVAKEYLVQIFRYVFSPILLLLAAIAIVAHIRRGPGSLWERIRSSPLSFWERVRVRADRRVACNSGPHPQPISQGETGAVQQLLADEMLGGTSLLLLFIAANYVSLCTLTPLHFFRYLAPAIPLLCMLGGKILDVSMRWHWTVGAVALAAILLLGHFPKYLDEITHHYVGPIDGIVEYLNAHGRPNDVVAITYGDMPLKFYTKMRVLGGLTGEDLAPALDANWVIFRRDIHCDKDEAVTNYLNAHLPKQRYRTITLDYPDIENNNREDPDQHRFRTATGVPGVKIMRRVRAETP